MCHSLMQDLADTVIAQLPRSATALVLRRNYNHEQGIAIWAREGGYSLKMYGGSSHGEQRPLDGNGEVFLTTAKDAAAQAFALARVIDQRGLELLYTPMPLRATPQNSVFMCNMLTTDKDKFKSVVEELLGVLHAVKQ